MAKHADPVDYRYATALETLFGYLYLTGQTERIKALLDQIIHSPWQRVSFNIMRPVNLTIEQTIF